MNFIERIEKEFSEHIFVAKNSALLSKKIDFAAKSCADSLKNGGRLFFCGNGGSAGDSQHLAAELIGRLKKNRKALPAISLTVDSSALTCIGNDFGFDNIFSRQLEGLGKTGDILIAISTSGNSINVINAVVAAKEKGIISIALTGNGGGKLASKSDIDICIPSDNTQIIQEGHLLAEHILCEILEQSLIKGL